MNSAAFAAKQARRVHAAVHSFAQGIVFLTRVSATSADGGTDGDEGWTSDDAQQQQQTARRMEPWGLHGRPAAGVLSAVLRAMGGAASNLRLGVWTGGHGRQNLDVGEVQLYCIASGCEVYLDKNGAVFVASATGQLIKVAGGTDFMIKGDTYRAAENTALTALTVVLTAVGTFATAVGVSVPATAAAAVTLNTAITTANTAINTFKNGANYLSTIAKVG